jgi:queuine/archaeosine tRNA-ribosyltransferase
MAGEMTAATLLTVHNLYFYLDLMAKIREAIGFGSFGKTPPGVSSNLLPKTSTALASR